MSMKNSQPIHIRLSAWRIRSGHWVRFAFGEMRVLRTLEHHGTIYVWFDGDEMSPRHWLTHRSVQVTSASNEVVQSAIRCPAGA